MGTNFYLMNPVTLNIHGTEREIHHIGKLSLAGLYCWHCERTLCVRGKKAVHGKFGDDDTSDWYMFCPQCGRHPHEGWGANVVRTDYRPTDEVRLCNSFHWAITPKTLNRLPKDSFIVGEDDVYTIDQFKEMLHIRCPIQSQESIWKEFV